MAEMRLEYRILCALLLTFVSVQGRLSTLKRGKYTFLEPFCTGTDIYVAIPWDCTGYVHCSNLGSQTDAYWIKCPQNLYYSMEAQTCMWPKDMRKPCPPLKDIIETYCLDHRAMRFQNPDHCAQYYDCSDNSFTPGLGPHLKECPFPQVYDPNINMCAEMSTVDCMDRFTPLNKCHYVQNTGTDCTAITTPGCEGQPDGPNPYPNRILTAEFLICQRNDTVSTQVCPAGQVFDPIKLQCTINVDKLSIEIYCATHLGGTMANPSHCGQYIDCNVLANHIQLGRHMGECPYPQLYSTQTSRCEMFEQVQCNTRFIPRQPCDYSTTLGSTSMQNCMATYSSCIGLPDGANAIPGGGVANKYIMCRSERTIEERTCPGGNSFDPMLKICTQSPEQGLVERQCKANPMAILPDPDNCARYFNCSDLTVNPNLVKYQAECDYPMLYNSVNMSCDDFTVVQCGTRLEPKAPCDYLSTTTKCKGPLCSLPCLERSPSCVGMMDGNNTYPTRELSPFYMTCLGERTVSVGICRFGVYDPTPRTCTGELEPSSIQNFCTKNTAGIIPHYTNCARYYNCSAAAIMSGGKSYLQECLYPQLFNLDTMGCEPYQTVECSFRVEPKGPCEYLQNQVCPPSSPNCLPCAQRIPSCAGLINGNNSFIGRDTFYVVCQDERTLFVRECVGGTFDPATRACRDKPAGPVFDPNRPSTFCTAYPTEKVPSDMSCAQYYDCSSQITLLGNYKMECPYTQLFDVNSGQCLPYNLVNCGLRMVPVDPCEYEANLRCPDVGACKPCRDRFVSCKGLTNGNFSIPNRPTEYRTCLDQRTLSVGLCANGKFDEASSSCIVIFDQRNPSPYCVFHPNALMPNPDNCAQFFDCRQQNTMFGNHLRECPYLQLYSVADKSCSPFQSVGCQGRPEPKAPCEYLQNQQCYDPAGCPPCEQTKPSCIGLKNGNNTFPGRPKEHIVCSMERTIAMEKCQFDYDIVRRECGRDMSNPNIFCELKPLDVLVHPTRCAQYYDCRLPLSEFGERYLQECPYPALFDVQTGTCQDFTNVNCAQRVVPIAPCEYQYNSCVGKGPGCVPCTERFVSCVGKPDGNNTYPDAEMTQRYVTCESGRTVGLGLCPRGFFDPIRRFCATKLDAVSIQSYCQQNPSVILANPLNCAQYFDCSPRSVSEGTFLRECPYPMLFSKTTNVCVNFTDVVCEQRMEPVEPCQYLQNICDTRQPGCVPCQDKHPSCVNLPNGFNMYPGREMTPDYIVCQSGRTISKEKCREGVFFPNRRECGLILDEQMATQYCRANPTAIMEHQTNCAQYYDCRNAVGGSFLRECRYPQLFDEPQQVCKNFSDVRCGVRFEPQAPCEYLQTQCLQNAVNCTPCPERLPSCIGLLDGSNPFPTRPNSQYYVKCFQNRTVAVEVCQVSLFDPMTKSCSDLINPTVLAGFCQENPAVLIPDPLHCARFYNCSDPSIQDGLGVPHLHECKYPRLFGYGATNCQLFTEIDCATRYEAKAPCEYVENQCFNTTCQPCQENYPSCVGKQDGSNNFPGREGTEYYIVCYKDRTVAIVTCTTGFYNHSTRSCEAAMKDASVNNAEAGEYAQNQQCYDPLGCPPCEQTNPSCIGLIDGNYTFPGRPKEHIVCSMERTVAMVKCHFDYDVELKECSWNMSNPNMFCDVHPLDTLVHPTRCAQYYDCRLPISEFGERYLQECPYPTLFDVQTGTCQDFAKVNCSQRVVPVVPCDYQYNTCVGKGPGCVPCAERFVSCIGKPDGNNSYPDAEMTQRYITCRTERTVGLGYCSSGYFDPTRRFCAATLDAMTIQSYCKQNPMIILANPLNCAQYLDCSPRSVTEGTFLRECPYPSLFSKTTNDCANFTDVVCEQRMEPVEPCQYLQNICDASQPGCVPCQENNPSCVNLPDGLNMYPGREMAPEYILCHVGRTLSKERCREGVFFPDRRQCGLILDDQTATQYCNANPSAIMEHHTNCAQYYDCRTAVGGSFLRECRYPQLFDQATEICKNFSDVRCGDRFEPQAPCEYLQTQCLQNAVNCTPCTERLPSCIGLPDGSNPFPSRPNSPYYVKCFQNRTVGVEVCQVSLFDPSTKVCSEIIDSTVLAGFCQENPDVLIPDPQHCARFYNCSDPSIQDGLGVPHLHECKYPRLFGYKATNCQLFTEVTCATRYEAKAPCEYVENQCFNTTCQPCQENYPSCVGKQDGSNNFTGREGTEYYIVCYKDRTVAIVTCTTGFYNHATKSCEAVMPQTGLKAGSISVA